MNPESMGFNLLSIKFRETINALMLFSGQLIINIVKKIQFISQTIQIFCN